MCNFSVAQMSERSWGVTGVDLSGKVLVGRPYL